MKFSSTKPLYYNNTARVLGRGWPADCPRNSGHSTGHRHAYTHYGQFEMLIMRVCGLSEETKISGGNRLAEHATTIHTRSKKNSTLEVLGNMKGPLVFIVYTTLLKASNIKKLFQS